jgi:hypothetical protein
MFKVIKKWSWHEEYSNFLDWLLYDNGVPKTEKEMMQTKKSDADTRSVISVYAYYL